MTQPTFISLETSAFSGATLLALLLGANPDITTVGEMRGLIDKANPETYLCSCGEKIIVCEFWKEVSKTMHRKGYPFNVSSFNTKFQHSGPEFLFNLRHGSSRNYFVDLIRDKIIFAFPKERQILSRYAKRNIALVESVLDVTGNNIFVDSSKSKMLLRTLPRFSDFDVRAIHLVRRVEGVVASQLRRSPDSDAIVEARNWVKRHKRIELSLRFLPEKNFTTIRYEDLCTNTELTLVKLLSFCGISNDVSRLNIEVTAQHVIGNPMRLKPLSAIKLDERWVNELSSVQIDQIRKVAGSMSEKYGYEAA